jgi:hypothetical protein
MKNHRNGFVTHICICIGALLIIGGKAVPAELELQGSNELLYLDGEEAYSGGYELKRVFEDYLHLSLLYGGFDLGCRFDFLQPGYFNDNLSLVPINYEGVRKLYAEYSSDHWRIRGGNIFGMFGSGLSLNLYEDRKANIDNELEGILLYAEHGFLQATFLGGRSAYRSYSDDIPTHPEHTVRGAEVLFRPSSMFEIGTGYVWADDRSRLQEVKLPSLRARLYTPFGDIWGEYVRSHIENALQGGKERGRGVYLGMSFYPPFAPFVNLTADYKYYMYKFGHNRYFFADPPYCRPSIYRLVLLNRYDFETHKDDEVGYQVECNVSIAQNSSLRLNYNVTSEISQGSNLPRAALRKVSPFEEMYLEGSTYLGDSELSLVLNQRKKRHIIPLAGPWYYLSLGDSRWRTAGAAFLQPLGGVHRVQVDVEVQEYDFMYDTSVYPELNDFTFWTQVFTLSYNWSPFFLIYLNVENSNEKEVRESQERKTPGAPTYVLEENYISAGIVITFHERHRLTILGGSERGGKICRGGTCIDIKPFKGARIELTSQL